MCEQRLRALVRTLVEASVDQVWGPSTGQTAYHVRQIMKYGLTEDLLAFVHTHQAQTGQVPTESSIREMLPLVRSFRGQGIKGERGTNLMNLGRRYMTEERCKELLDSLGTE
jgi:hypothetical protein